MSTSHDSDMLLVSILSVTSMVFTAHHTWKFDKWRCLLPRKKDWFRFLLTWMLIMSNVGVLIWGIGWTFVKYKLGWTIIPGHGAVPLPDALWTDHYRNLNLPLTFWLAVAYCLQVSLNAEEGLYWYHLMRAVRRPKSAKSWLSSTFFITWIVITVATFIAQFGAGWIGKPDYEAQMARMFATGGVIELLVCLSASIVIVKFPAFLDDVKSTGAGPEVRARLHFYHEANKVRTFFRLLFTICILMMGIDGLSSNQRINHNHVAFDIIQQVIYSSYFFAYIVSVVLYLPRNWGSKNARISAQVMVGRTPPNQAEASHSLMSLLREGGQWDDEDDLRAGRSRFDSGGIKEGQWIEKGPTSQWDAEQPVPRVHEMNDPVNTFGAMVSPPA